MLRNTIENLHAEIGGGYAEGSHIEIVAGASASGKAVVTTSDGSCGREMEAVDNGDVKEAFMAVVKRYAEPLQAAFLAANLEPGKRYTIFHLGHNYGFPIAKKFTYVGMELATYAQNRDVVKLFFRPHRSRKIDEKYFYGQSFIICRGWHDIDEAKVTKTLADEPGLKVKTTKYGCFDARYIEDAKSYLPEIIAVYEDYKVGKDGKLYA